MDNNKNFGLIHRGSELFARPSYCHFLNCMHWLCVRSINQLNDQKRSGLIGDDAGSQGQWREYWKTSLQSRVWLSCCHKVWF